VETVFKLARFSFFGANTVLGKKTNEDEKDEFDVKAFSSKLKDVSVSSDVVASFESTLT
jgi:hypothetical protein